MGTEINIAAHQEGAVLQVKVVPNSSRDAIVGPLGTALKVKVAKPPEAGAANRAVEELLAEALGVAKSRVSVVGGLTQPLKQVLVRGMAVEAVRGKLGARGGWG